MLLVGEVGHYHAGEDLDSHCQDQWDLMSLLKESFSGVLAYIIKDCMLFLYLRGIASSRLYQEMVA